MERSNKIIDLDITNFGVTVEEVKDAMWKIEEDLDNGRFSKELVDRMEEYKNVLGWILGIYKCPVRFDY